MPPSFRLPALNRKTKSLLGVLLALAALVVLFDWNWLRGPLERYYSEKSGRDVRIGHLDVDLGFSLVPTVRLRDVHIPNAPWGSERPLVTARELAITFSIASMFRQRPVISRIVLADAAVSLERQADGLRNWRLRHPENRAPGRAKVLALEAQRTQITFVNRASDLELVAVASPLDAKAGDERFTTRITFKGSYEGAPFTGDAQNGGVVSFHESGLAFPLRGHVISGKTRVDIDGSFTDVFDLGPMDAALRLSGPSLSQLHPFVRIRPPPSRPFDLRAQLTQRDRVYTFAGLSGKIGETDLAGQATYDRSGERSRVEADLSSASADLLDLRSLVGLPPPSSRSGGQAAGADGIFPSRAISADKFRAFDARLKMNARKLKAADIPMLDSLRLEARLTDGALELKPIDLGVAGGHLTGSITLNAQREPASSSAVIELRDLRLERLLPSLAEKTRGAGAIRGHIELSGRGNSIAAIVGSSSGSLAATMARGRISSLADAKLGLDFGKVLRTFIRGDRDNAIHCGALSFDVRNGVGKSQTIVLDTDQTHVDGAGTIDLRKEQLDLTLTPEPRKPGLFTRRASIRLHGPFRTLRTSIEERVEPQREAAPAACASR